MKGGGIVTIRKQSNNTLLCQWRRKKKEVLEINGNHTFGSSKIVE
jgi:hypothetical protein